MASRVEHGAAVRLDGISRYYGSVAAVEGVSLDVAPGEFITLLGPSGSGKSTTLNIIAGFDRADAGEVLVDGHPIGRLPAHKRNMGMVFQHYALFPHLTVEQNVAYPLEERRLAKAEILERTRRALSMVQLSDYGARRISQISGGQQQRVALARAIVFQPRVLLMDEPLGALDKKLREQLQQEFKALHRNLGVTVFFVTHDQEEALALSDRIAVFRDGKIEQVGTPLELWDTPRTPFVADFLGGANLIPGAVEGVRFVCGAADYPIPAGNAVAGSATLLVRPERLRLAERQTRPSRGLAWVDGRIALISFTGQTRRLTVDCGEQGIFVAVEQDGRFSAFSEGADVAVEWSVDDARILPGNDQRIPNVLTRFQAV
jgi:putative spermidine/putrescine transport system ATP-binding protein